MKTKRGGALLEVIAAITLMMISGLAGAALFAQTAHSIKSAENTEALTAIASDRLNRISLWSRPRLEAAVGESTDSLLAIHISHSSDALYRVEVAGAHDGGRVLETIIYRPSVEGR